MYTYIYMRMHASINLFKRQFWPYLVLKCLLVVEGLTASAYLEQICKQFDWQLNSPD